MEFMADAVLIVPNIAQPGLGQFRIRNGVMNRVRAVIGLVSKDQAVSLRTDITLISSAAALP
jgi:hypothetical protein